ncbi:MAG: c-type cytochrome biogenesis protein CcsB [Eubacterium sp.]|nr:c-type cytochrome biogenesis protein CcsB [Eubacterium sp.]
MLNVIFFGGLVLYFISMFLQFAGMVFRKEAWSRIAWFLFLGGFALVTVYLIARGVAAHRLPLSNQFEFAAAFSWAIGALLVFCYYKLHIEWMQAVGIAAAFLILSYAALQPREITDLMPALRSSWFGFHIGSAAISYAGFMLAGGVGVRYILISRKNKNDKTLVQMDFFIYRLIALGLLMLTITIVTGAIWAEEAWSSFWTWDPKEVWALITWIIYAVYLHLRINRKRRGEFLAWYAIGAVPVVLFTFIGVNTLMPGLHSYGALETIRHLM